MSDDLLGAVQGPGGNVGYLLRRARQAFRAAMEVALTPHGLTVPQYGALSVFDAVAELSSADLARISDVTPQSINTVVHQLDDAEADAVCAWPAVVPEHVSRDRAS